MLEGVSQLLLEGELHVGVRPLELPFIEKVRVAVRAPTQYLGPVVYPVFPQRGEFVEKVGRLWEGLDFTRASFGIEVNRDPRGDGGGYLVAGPEFWTPYWV